MEQQSVPELRKPVVPMNEETPLVRVKFKRRASSASLSSSSSSTKKIDRRRTASPEENPLNKIESVQKARALSELQRSKEMATKHGATIQRSQSAGDIPITNTPIRRVTEQKVGVLPPQAILNLDSHHVRAASVAQQKEKKKMHEIDQYKEMERCLIRSIRIDTRLERIIKERLIFAIQHKMLRIPLISFMNSRYGIEFFSDYKSLETKYDIVNISDLKAISDDQFSLDLLRNEPEYSNIVSILIYLSNHTPRLVYIIAKRNIAFSLKAPELFPDSEVNTTTNDEQDSMVLFQKEQQQEEQQFFANNHHLLSMAPKSNELTLFDRAYMNLFKDRETATYYMIIVDLAQSHRKTNTNAS